MRPDEQKQPNQQKGAPAGAPIRSRAPEYRYDHELPAPKPLTLLENEKPNLLLEDENKPKKRKSSVAKKLLIIFSALIAIIIAVAIGAYVWYQQQLSPVSNDTGFIQVKIVPGTAPSAIGDQLKQAGVIRSKLAFSLYTKLTKTENTLKAGTYKLQPSQSTKDVVDVLVAGKQETFKITFLPGDTLANHKKRLIQAGFSEAEVDEALNKTYDRPLFATKPASADLEGYIFGDTYTYDVSSTVESILNQTFDEFEVAIEQNDIVNLLKKQNLTLFQGITLASVVQREVTNPMPNIPNDDQRQVAKVFLNRMAIGMNLGSDVTYQYAARKMGVAPTPTLNSPYNTRIHTGLPPGPIASPGIGAIVAVATPASNDYLFFLSGDDDITYFGKTEAEHQRNITAHCAKKCLIN